MYVYEYVWDTYENVFEHVNGYVLCVAESAHVRVCEEVRMCVYVCVCVRMPMNVCHVLTHDTP
jgi:hypothetical protein